MALPFGHRISTADPGVRHIVVASSGASAPAGGHYFFFFNARLNARPEVAFDAILSGPSTTGVFVGNGRRTSTIALGGDPDPAAGSFNFVTNPFITRHGRVVFDVEGSGIFTSTPREIVPLVQNGDGAPGGGTVTRVAHAVNDRGAVAFLALVSDSAATQGIFRTDGTETVAIARDDIGAPTGGSFTSLFNPVINDRGEVAFGAEMSGGAAQFGVFRGDGGNLVPVFVANQIAPGGGTFTDFGNPAINARGQVAAIGDLTNGGSSRGLFVGDETNAVAVAFVGRPAPKGGNYKAFLAPLRLNDRGEIAFPASLTGGTSTFGIFRGDGERTTAVAIAGTIAPGTSGRFESFHDIRLGNDGRVGFIATLAVGVGGVDSSNNMGIWIGNSDDDLQLVVRTGEIIAGHVLTGLPTGVSGFNQFDMNQNAVVWIGGFQPTARAIVFSQIIGRNREP
jgi:hypothetical protein